MQELEGERRECEGSRHSHREALRELTEERDVLAKQVRSLKHSLEEEKEHSKGDSSQNRDTVTPR